MFNFEFAIVFRYMEWNPCVQPIIGLGNIVANLLFKRSKITMHGRKFGKHSNKL